MPLQPARISLGLLLSLSPLLAAAQAPALTRPLAGVHYRYWPQQMVQWIGPELPYSMVVLDIDNRAKPAVYDLELIPKNGAKAMHYTNSSAEEALDRRIGFTVHQVAMQFDGPDEPSKGAQYMLRFNTETGVPVVWQFVLETDVTEQGSGVSPVAAPVPVLLYREQGGVAGEGTAIQIGGVTSTADVWKEIAQPPYFIPYHGAFSVGVHVLSFAPGQSTWRRNADTLVDSAGTTLTVASQGDTLLLTNQALGTTATYSGSSPVSKVSFGAQSAKHDHTLSLDFSPALATTGSSNFAVIAGKKDKIATGSVTISGNSLSWTFNTPDTLHGAKVEAGSALQP